MLRISTLYCISVSSSDFAGFSWLRHLKSTGWPLHRISFTGVCLVFFSLSGWLHGFCGEEYHRGKVALTSHHITRNTVSTWLAMLTVVTWLRHCVPGFSTTKSLRISSHSLFIRIKSLCSPETKGRRIKFCFLDREILTHVKICMLKSS